jgi:hypothetical protein
MATTPTGAGDPNAIVCRAPQPIEDSGQLGPQVCLHNNEWWKVAMNGKDVAPDGKTLIDRPTVKDPKGDGDPDVVTCRTPQFVERGPPVAICRPNRFWADVIKNHQMVDARGNVMARPMDTDYGPPYGPGGNPSDNSCGDVSRLGRCPGGAVPFDSGRQHYGPPSGTP